MNNFHKTFLMFLFSWVIASHSFAQTQVAEIGSATTHAPRSTTPTSNINPKVTVYLLFNNKVYNFPLRISDKATSPDGNFDINFVKFNWLDLRFKDTKGAYSYIRGTPERVGQSKLECPENKPSSEHYIVNWDSPNNQKLTDAQKQLLINAATPTLTCTYTGWAIKKYAGADVYIEPATVPTLLKLGYQLDEKSLVVSKKYFILAAPPPEVVTKNGTFKAIKPATTGIKKERTRYFELLPNGVTKLFLFPQDEGVLVVMYKGPHKLYYMIGKESVMEIEYSS